MIVVVVLLLFSIIALCVKCLSVICYDCKPQIASGVENKLFCSVKLLHCLILKVVFAVRNYTILYL